MTIFLCLICFSIYDKMQGFISLMNLVCLCFYILFYFFCVLRRNSRWPPKVSGKQFWGKVPNRLCRYPVGQKFRRNRSISLRFRDKCIFVFNTEIQDGRQKWRGKGFFFCEIMPLDSTDTLRVKNFVEIALSRSVSEINTFLHFTQKFKMAAKRGGKMIFAKNRH